MIDFPYKKFLSSELDPAEFYQRELDKRLRAVCDSYRGKKIHATTELEPLWDFVVTLALARLFNVGRAVYEHYDKQVDCMTKDTVVDLALRSGEVIARKRDNLPKNKFLVAYFSAAASCGWLADNICFADKPVPASYHRLHILRDLVKAYAEILDKIATPGSQLLADFTRLAGMTDLALFQDCFIDLPVGASNSGLYTGGNFTAGEPECHE